MKLFNKKSTNYTTIRIQKETYTKLKVVSDMEHKNFTEIIEEGLKGKKIVL